MDSNKKLKFEICCMDNSQLGSLSGSPLKACRTSLRLRQRVPRKKRPNTPCLANNFNGTNGRGGAGRAPQVTIEYPGCARP
jgi:hypothetical protein